MKVLKIILLIIWAFITFGLIVYSQMMKTEALRQQSEVERKTKLYNECVLSLEEMSKTHLEYYENMVLLRNDNLHKIDIDSLFENSFFLSNYDRKVQSEN